WAALGRAWITPSPSRHSPLSRRARRPPALPHPAPAPKREPRSSAAVESALPIIGRGLGIAGSGRTVTDPSAPRGRPPSRPRPPRRKPKERAVLLLGQAPGAGLQILQRRANPQLLVLDEVVHRR